MESPETKNPITDPKYLLLSIPLYRKIKISLDEKFDILNFEFYKGNIDTYCKTCGKNGTFVRVLLIPPCVSIGAEGYSLPFDETNCPTGAYFYNTMHDGKNYYSFREMNQYIVSDRNIYFYFVCTRCYKQIHSFYFSIINSELIKVGQLPSMVDLSKNEISRYTTILRDDKSEELRTAFMLNSSGLGIAAFVYLRRILEYLIEEAHIEAQQQPNWMENKYEGKRIDEKIILLKTLLPEFLVENRKIYSILSKGVHELSESECLDFFDPARISIELILDQKVEKLERKRKEHEAKLKVDQMVEKMSGKNLNGK